MKQVLYTIYLKHDSACQSLEISALSQLIVKILYAQNKPLTIDEINQFISPIVKKKISPEKITNSITEIKSNLSINSENHTYKIRDSYKKKLDFSYSERENRFNRIIEKYFTEAESDRKNIEKWFEDVSIDYFCEFSTEWINEISSKETRNRSRISYNEIICKREHFKTNKIHHKDKKWLADQYRNFLNCSEPDENALMWDYGNSLFASKIITSSEYIDKSISDMLKDSLLVLDTNILMRLDLEKDKYSDSYNALEKILISLNVKPVYFHITEKEYNLAIENKIEEIKNLQSKYKNKPKVYQEIDDAFIQTAINRQCTEEEHYDIFFEHISKIPETISTTLRIEKFDYRDLIDAINNGASDQNLLGDINSIYKERYGCDKSIASLKHDAGLISGGKFLNEDQRSWIFSRDGTVIEYARTHSIREEVPIVISIDSMLNLLAINDGFDNISESSFIPLFANLVRSSIGSIDNVFQIEDLLYMKDIESQIDSLSDEQIVKIAQKVNRNRVNGIHKSKIALDLERDFQKAKLDITEELTATREEVSKEKRVTERLRVQNSSIKKNFYRDEKKDIERRYKKKRNFEIGTSLTINFIMVCLLSYIFFKIVKIEQLNTYYSVIVGLIIGIIPNFIGSKYFIFPRIIKKYNTSISGIDDEIDEKWERYLKE
jgi:hypothetical protein